MCSILKNTIFVLFTVLFYNTVLVAQINIENLNPAQTKKFIKSAVRTSNIDLTIDLLEHLCKIRPNSLKARFNLGMAYFSKREYEKAAQNFSAVYKMSPDKNSKALYFAAKMLKYSGNVEASKTAFNQFQKKAKRTKFYYKHRKEIESEIAGLNLDSIENTTILISRLSDEVNTPGSKFSPVIINKNEFIFSGYDETANRNEFYKATQNENTWEKKKDVFAVLSKLGYSVGSGGFSVDSLRFYFTVCKENWQNKNICEIYVMTRIGDDWQNPRKLPKPVNLNNYTSTHPTASVNSKNADVLYFASDRNGGYGGMDIWYTEYDIKNEEFIEPKNVGAKINTSADEVTPFIDSKSHCLYFSSNGFAGLGGLDIFKAWGEKRKWSKPENLRQPLNSGADDFFYSVRENAGYLVSNRADSASGKTETCCDDIFAFTINPVGKFIIKGTIYNLNPDGFWAGKSIKHPQNIKVLLYMKNENDYFLADECFTNENGEYSFPVDKKNDYKILVTSVSGEDYIDVASSEMKNVSADTLTLMAMGIDYIPAQPIALDDVFYAFNDFELTDEAKTSIKATLLPFLKENPGAVIEIGSHTDSKGDDQYNLELSQKRAQSVVNYLVENGISPDRLVAKGFGESAPLAANVLLDGSDNEMGRRMNRRTEFKILSFDNILVAENKQSNRKN